MIKPTSSLAAVVNKWILTDTIISGTFNQKKKILEHRRAKCYFFNKKKWLWILRLCLDDRKKMKGKKLREKKLSGKKMSEFIFSIDMFGWKKNKRKENRKRIIFSYLFVWKSEKERKI